MSENWDISRDHQIKEKILQLRRRRVMRRFDQHVAGISNGQETAVAKPRDKIGRHMDIRPGGEAKRNPLLIEKVLQLRRRLPDGRSRIMIEPGQNMRGASDLCHALRDHHPRHSQRYRRIARAIVNSR